MARLRYASEFGDVIVETPWHADNAAPPPAICFVVPDTEDNVRFYAHYAETL
jgi:hypothetical protein